MNKKIIVAVIAVVIIVAAVGAVFLLKGDKDKELNVLAAVNTEGSGIYIDSSVDKNTMFDFDQDIPQPIASGWEKKVFGTPGTATIQHIQLMGLVEGMGLTFKLYTPGASESGVVYYDSAISNAVTAINTPHINGGILWQPQYEKIIDSDRFQGLVLTNELFPGHACCVIAGNHEYTSSHEDETVRFIAAFVKATNWVNNALSDKTSDDYARLVNIAVNVTGSNFTEAEIEEALDTVTYHYGDDSDTPLANLGQQISTLADELYELGVVKKTPQDLGFNDNNEFVEKFVDDSFLLKALDFLADDSYEANGTANIKVAVISGDIHQIAVHVANQLGFFEEYGLNVSFSNATNGSGVATAIQNGEASFGLLGAPPLTTTVINGELVRA